MFNPSGHSVLSIRLSILIRFASLGLLVRFTMLWVACPFQRAFACMSVQPFWPFCPVGPRVRFLTAWPLWQYLVCLSVLTRFDSPVGVNTFGLSGNFLFAGPF